MAFGMFSSVFGRDCSEIETDPRADPFEKEICRNIRQFEDAFHDFSSGFPSFSSPLDREEESETLHLKDTPQSLRDSILSRDSPNRDSRLPHKRYTGDQNLDEDISNDPHLLNELLRNDDNTNSSRKDFSKSYSSSVRISTIRKQDGTVEERKTMKDSDGNEEVTVTTTYPDGSTDIVKEYL